MKFISWNVNGLRAVMNKDFKNIFDALDADIFCLQETKLQEGQIDFAPEGYYCYWNYAEKKGYSGTAIFSKIKPISVFLGMGIEEHDREGRVITLEFEDFYFITVYVPNSQDELKRLSYRMKWEEDFLKYIKGLEEKKPVIFCGDLNVAHKEIDLKNPKTNRKNAGFTDEEREKMTLGGAIASRQEKRTQGGALTISLPRERFATDFFLLLSTTKFSVLTTVPLSLSWVIKLCF